MRVCAVVQGVRSVRHGKSSGGSVWGVSDNATAGIGKRSDGAVEIINVAGGFRYAGRGALVGGGAAHGIISPRF